MLMTVFKVLYVVIAILMSAFILLQRGAGAQQGGGFGAGASATVFGASGSANFLSKSTKWLAALFFGLSIAMAAMISKSNQREVTAVNAGVMTNFSETPTVVTPAAVGATSEVPVVVPASGADAVVPAAAPATDAPVPVTVVPATTETLAPAAETLPADVALATQPVEAATDKPVEAATDKPAADKPVE